MQEIGNYSKQNLSKSKLSSISKKQKTHLMIFLFFFISKNFIEKAKYTGCILGKEYKTKRLK
jgi:hypothetical protein